MRALLVVSSLCCSWPLLAWVPPAPEPTPTTPTTPETPPTTTQTPPEAPPEETPPETTPQRDETATKEEEVDFDEEEQKSDAESARIKGSAGAGSGGAAQETSSGLKLFVDFLALSDLPKKNFVFRPNHTYVFVVAQVAEDMQFIIHVDTNPIFYELQWDALPSLSFKVGKLMIPFGQNDFHHLIGGRVDEQSFFLPETWSDFGVAINHTPLDTELLNIEYTLYAVNGSQGAVAQNAATQQIPTIGAGATATDNNYMKAIGGRGKFTLLKDYVVTPSFYYDVWDSENKFKLLFYGLGIEARKGFLPFPVLDRLRLRGEYARGEIELPFRNLQPGVLSLVGDGYAVGRVGFYGEATAFVVDTFSVRLRAGRINGNNTLSDDQDLWMLEPALLVTMAHGKVQLTLAYQFLTPPDFSYDPLTPGDRVYAKVFLQF